tara:strand:+ start:438 stop:1199 length:762 start_codon:yes stop_codon:yes gene_type:complete
MSKRTNETFVDADDIGEASPMEYKTESTLDDASPDTNGDPVGSEERAKQDPVKMPLWYFDKYDLDGNGKPIPSIAHVNAIMEMLPKKIDTAPFFGNDKTAGAKLAKQYDADVKALVDAYRPLLAYEAGDTGFNFMMFANATWGKYLTALVEFGNDVSRFSDQEMPDWLVTREDNAFGMGRKARLVRDVLAILSDEFKLKNAVITPANVRSAVQRHLQGLATWTFNKHADSSARVSGKLNEANAEYVQGTLASM